MMISGVLIPKPSTMNLTKLVLSTLLSFLISVSFCQSMPGSAYNIFGIGSLEKTGLVSFKGMGNVGIAVRSPEDVNLKNPAALNAITGYNQIFDGGFTYSRLSQQSDNKSFSTSNGGVNSLNYWFRNSSKMAMSFGFEKVSDASYDITDSNSGVNTFGIDETRHLGGGGASSFYVGAGYELIANLNVGLKFNLLFGSIEQSEIFYSQDLISEFLVEENQRFTASGIELGFQYGIPIGENKKITLGSIFKSGSKVRLSHEGSIMSASDTITSSSEYSSLIIPPKFGLGLGMQIKSWNFNLDYEVENWQRNEEESNYAFNKRTELAGGISFQKDRSSTTYFNRAIFRVGGSLSTNYIKIGGTDHLQASFSAGLGLPIGRRGTINLAYQYVNNGLYASDLIYEQYHAFSLGFSFKNVWFLDGKYD